MEAPLQIWMLLLAEFAVTNVFCSWERQLLTPSTLYSTEIVEWGDLRFGRLQPEADRWASSSVGLVMS